MPYSADTFSAGEVPTTAKWNKLWTNDASFNDGTGIADSAIKPKHLLTGTGSTWAWTSFTPSWTNFTPGNATVQAYYRQIGKSVGVRVHVTLGSTSSMSTGPLLTLPVTSASTYTAITQIIGVCVLEGNYGAVRWRSTTTVDPIVFNSASTYVVANGVTATVPVTWATGHTFSMAFEYEAA